MIEPARRFRNHARLFCLALCLAAMPAMATTLLHGPSPEIAPEQNEPMIEIARLRMQNTAGGLIEGSRDGGATWKTIGHITNPTIRVNRKGFNASKYAPIGTVAASAVNAMHLKASQNTEENRGVIWSLAPAPEEHINNASLQSEVSPESAAYTDIPGGSGIFGGPFTPFVGNHIFLDNDRVNKLLPLPSEYVPKVGDVWVIPIERPKHYPKALVFENRFGGRITIQYRDEEPRIIGEVLRPVLGIGRFQGSYFADVGRVRANHCGVIDIATCPHGKTGSFQIVPANHAMSPETDYIRELTQWMVVGPASVTDPSREGTAPLFSQFIRPRYDHKDVWDDDPVEGMAGRFLIQVKKAGSDQWQPMPTLWLDPNKPLPSWAGTALADVTEIGIMFPFTWDDGSPLAPTGPLPISATDDGIVPVAASAAAPDPAKESNGQAAQPVK